MTILTRLKRKLIQKVLSDVTPADIRDGLVALNPSERQDLVRAVRHMQRDRVGGMLIRAVVANVVEPRAQQEAQDIIDSGCDIDDLDRVLTP